MHVSGLANFKHNVKNAIFDDIIIQNQYSRLRSCGMTSSAERTIEQSKFVHAAAVASTEQGTLFLKRKDQLIFSQRFDHVEVPCAPLSRSHIPAVFQT